MSTSNKSRILGFLCFRVYKTFENCNEINFSSLQHFYKRLSSTNLINKQVLYTNLDTFSENKIFLGKIVNDKVGQLASQNVLKENLIKRMAIYGHFTWKVLNVTWVERLAESWSIHWNPRKKPLAWSRSLASIANLFERNLT